MNNLKFNKNRIIEIGFIIIFTYIPLFIIEYSFRLIIKNKTYNREELYKLKTLDARSNGYFPYYTPKEIMNLKRNFYPLSGKPNTNTYLCDEGYGLVKYKSDRFGFRNGNKNWDLIKDNNSVFFIGDSFIHGACVENKNTIPEVFQKNSGIVSLNLGASGASPVHYKALLELIVKPLIEEYSSNNKFKNIYIIFYGNDNCKTCLPEKKAYLKLSNENHPLIFDKGKIAVNLNYTSNINLITDKVEKLISSNRLKKNNLILKSIKLQYLRLRFSRYIYSLGLRKNYNKNDATQLSISTLSDICIKKCRPYAAFIPPKANNDGVHSSKRYAAHIKKTSDFYGVNYLDLSTVINSNRESDYAPEGSHLSLEGYKKVALYLLQKSNLKN